MTNGCTHRGWWCHTAGDPTPAACSSDCAGRPPAHQSEPASSSWRAGPWQPLHISAVHGDQILGRIRGMSTIDKNVTETCHPLHAKWILWCYTFCGEFQVPAFLVVKYIIFFFFLPPIPAHSGPETDTQKQDQTSNLSTCDDALPRWSAFEALSRNLKSYRVIRRQHH